MAERKVRIHFALSPTGALHIGGVRTALYNYLFVRQYGGDLIFRIRDTNSDRSVPGAEEYILESFEWLGTQFDEGVGFGGRYGPCRQSERRKIYKKYVQVSLDNGKVYTVFDTSEELDAKHAEITGFQYDVFARVRVRDSLTLSQEEVKALIADGKQCVVRFKTEPNEDIHVDDLTRGEAITDSSILDDKVLYKSAGELPTYHLANIVNDHLMEVSHVIRGEEWSPFAPLRVLLYRTFDREDIMPIPAHLPLLLKPEGSGRLSERDGDHLGSPVSPLEWHDPKNEEVSSGYYGSGYLSEVVINSLTLLEWNPSNDREVMSMDELIRLFNLHRCSKSGAKFDYRGGVWFNHTYIQQKSDEEIAELFVPVLRERDAEAPFEKVVTVVGMTKDRVSLVKELWDAYSSFFVAPIEYGEKTARERWKKDSAKYMAELVEILAGIEDFSVEGQEKIVVDWIAEKGYHTGNIMDVFRLTPVGEDKGPHMLDIFWVLGKEETLAHMKRAVEVLKQESGGMFYDLAIGTYGLLVHLAAPFSRKPRKMVKGHRVVHNLLRQQVEKNTCYIWFHAASSEELEQGCPLIEKIRERYPDYRILQTSFSPPGYEVQKNYHGADIVCYLPFDKPRNVKKFPDIVDPCIVFFTKCELWKNCLDELHKCRTPVYNVSPISRKDQIFFRWYGGTYRNVLKDFDHLFVQNETSKRLLAKIGTTRVTAVGDTRFDHVLQICEQAKELPLVEQFKDGTLAFVAGSSRGPDGDLFVEYLNNHPEMRLIIAPHVIDEGHLAGIISKLKRPSVRYTRADEKSVRKANCLTIDCFSLLSSIYRYGEITCIRGGFGVGIRNTSEAAVCGIPVIFGPKHQKFMEAVQLIEAKGAYLIKDYGELKTLLDRLLSDEKFLKEMGINTGNYVTGNSGVTDKVLHTVSF